MAEAKKRIKFRAITRDYKEQLPGIIDAHQLKPMVEAMDIANKPIEEQITTFGGFVTFSGFQRVRAKKDDKYAATYSSASLKYNQGNCRHRTAMFSALLEAAGIEHNVYSGLLSIHPSVKIKLPQEKIIVDFGGSMTIRVKKHGTEQRWFLDWEKVEHNSSNALGMIEITPTEKLKALGNNQEFKDGMNQFLFKKAIEGKPESSVVTLHNIGKVRKIKKK